MDVTVVPRPNRKDPKSWHLRYRPGKHQPQQHIAAFPKKELALAGKFLAYKDIMEGLDPRTRYNLMPEPEEIVYLALREYEDGFFRAHPEWSDGTARLKQFGLGHIFTTFGDRRPDQICFEEVQDWVWENGMPNDEGKVRWARGTLDQYLTTFALLLDFIGIYPNPVRENGRGRKLKRPSESVAPYRVVPTSHVVAVLGEVESRIHLPIWILATTGMRPHEVAGLRWDYISVAKKRFVIHKSKTRAGVRQIDVHPAVMAEIAALSQDDDRVFPWLETEMMSQAIRKACARLGLPPFTSKALRHRSCSHMVAAGIPAPDVSVHHGHTDTRETLNTYSQVLVDDDATPDDAYVMPHHRKMPTNWLG